MMWIMFFALLDSPVGFPCWTRSSEILPKLRKGLLVGSSVEDVEQHDYYLLMAPSILNCILNE